MSDKLLLTLCLTGCLVVSGSNIYNNCFREKETIYDLHTVRAGDTMWSICSDYYISENNVDCFNEFWSKNMKNNGKRSLNIGDSIIIANTVYKK